MDPDLTNHVLRFTIENITSDLPNLLTAPRTKKLGLPAVRGAAHVPLPNQIYPHQSAVKCTPVNRGLITQGCSDAENIRDLPVRSRCTAGCLGFRMWYFSLTLEIIREQFKLPMYLSPCYFHDSFYQILLSHLANRHSNCLAYYPTVNKGQYARSQKDEPPIANKSHPCKNLLFPTFLAKKEPYLPVVPIPSSPLRSFARSFPLRPASEVVPITLPHHHTATLPSSHPQILRSKSPPELSHPTNQPTRQNPLTHYSSLNICSILRTGKIFARSKPLINIT